MKRLFSTLTGLVLLASASGCCCDCCNWGCCNPCRSCSTCPPACAPVTGSAPASGAISSAPATYYGTSVAAVPIESLPTY
ncbi:MAG: hypothetical protein HY290_06335 [Planctomycetia bacterium]|nr:hypothetical protein [Planctomycetia bacterium]